MKRLLYLIPLFMLASCGGGGGSDDGPDPPKPTPTETNSNKNDASVVTQLAGLEFPKIKGGENNVIITHKTPSYGITYSMEWDRSLRAQRWTCYVMNRGNYASNGNSRKKLWPDGDPWGYDPTIPMEDQQATYNELSKSYYPGAATTSDNIYQKGHICPSGDRLAAKDPNEQTYYMTNIMPMVSKFNSGIWQTMETRLRGWLGDPDKRTWSNYCDTLFICKGGTIDKSDQILGYTVASAQVNGEEKAHPGNHIVPKYFFMALLAKKGDTYKALGFWVEHLNEDHSSDPLINYAVNIDKLEELTGIDFFCNLPDNIEKEVEGASEQTLKLNWGL